MGQYFRPPEELATIGRQLNPGSYGKLLGQISSEEFLFGLYDRGTSLVAPRLSSIQEFNHYEAQYRRQKAISRTFWAVPKSTVVLKNYSIYEQRSELH